MERLAGFHIYLMHANFAQTAPEVLRHLHYTEKADIYRFKINVFTLNFISYAVVMWECLTREDPYAGMPPFRVIFCVGHEGLRPPIPPSCPPGYFTLVNDCWNEHALSRYNFAHNFVTG